MTKFETTITRIGCNVCDNPVIEWVDKEDENHLCVKCLGNNSKFDWSSSN
jgi:hypothetical protein